MMPAHVAAPQAFAAVAAHVAAFAVVWRMLLGHLRAAAAPLAVMMMAAYAVVVVAAGLVAVPRAKTLGHRFLTLPLAFLSEN